MAFLKACSSGLGRCAPPAREGRRRPAARHLLQRGPEVARRLLVAPQLEEGRAQFAPRLEVHRVYADARAEEPDVARGRRPARGPLLQELPVLGLVRIQGRRALQVVERGLEVPARLQDAGQVVARHCRRRKVGDQVEQVVDGGVEVQPPERVLRPLVTEGGVVRVALDGVRKERAGVVPET